jgi:DNA-binding transcriptional LysR family regulator
LLRVVLITFFLVYHTPGQVIMADVPSLSTDQVLAFVELSRQGSIRAAANVLHLTEQGLRNRLLALEKRLGIQLYRKLRGVRRSTPLTAEGQRFLPHAIAFLERAAELCELFAGTEPTREVNVVASQYLTTYVLIDAVKEFHKAYPNIHIRLSTRTEANVERTLLDDPETVLGVAAPYASPPELAYRHLFSMEWSLITALRHPLASSQRIRLAQLVDEPLILYERGSTGRLHIMDAFHAQNLSPRVDMEATSTDVAVRMVEAGLGISIVPLLPSGIITRGRRIYIAPLGQQVRPIHSGILMRKGEPLSPSAQEFVRFVEGKVITSGA